MNRRDFLYKSGLTLAGATAAGSSLSLRQSFAVENVPPFFTSPEQVQQRFLAASPLHGAVIPKDIVHRLGATHYGGKYFLTDKPYLVEGAEALFAYGMRCIKLWLGRRLDGYEFNWKSPLTSSSTLLDVISLPVFQQVIHMPFDVYSFEISAVRDQQWSDKDTFAEEEEQFEELANYLLTTFKDRNVTFILQHWEGDWILRGKQRDQYKAGNKVDASERAGAMVRWLQARQTAVEKARASHPESRCRVYNVSEVNRVYDALLGLPSVITDVIPHVQVDGVSWSSYDGLGSAVKTWQGLDIIEHFSGLHRAKKPFLMVGEVGLPEHKTKLTTPQIYQWWDTTMGVLLARQIPYIFQWELYDNEVLNDADNKIKPITDINRLGGFWLIKPDGTLGLGAKYLQALLQHAGEKLPPALIKSFS
jgi:hypothetical protein